MSEPHLRLLEPETLRAPKAAELLATLRALRADLAAEGQETQGRWPRPLARHAFKLGSVNLAH